MMEEEGQRAEEEAGDNGEAVEQSWGTQGRQRDNNMTDKWTKAGQQKERRCREGIREE